MTATIVLRRAALAVVAGTAIAAASGCAPLVVGGAMVGTALVVTDRRTSGTQLEDQSIEVKAGNRVRETYGDRVRVSVTSYNRLVLLTGEASNEADRIGVEQLVQKVENVRVVVNELAVLGPSSLTSRSNDAFLSGSVKASLVDAKDLSANAFKVVSERGTVYLLGRVTEREGNRAAEVARGVSGVQKVVKVFEPISEAELAALASKPTPPPTKN